MSSLTKMSIGLSAFLFLIGSLAFSQSKSVVKNIKSIPNPFHTVEYSVPDAALPVEINPSWITLNPITNGIENIRTLLGGGRRIVLDESGNIHVTGLTGSGVTYSLWYTVSDNGGTSFNNFTSIGTNGSGGRDRYPAIAVKGTKVNIAFHNQITGAGHVAYNPLPLGGGSFTLTDPLTSTPSCWLPMIYADQTSDNIIATWVEFSLWPAIPISIAKSTNKGASWFSMGIHPDSMFNLTSTYGPIQSQIITEGNYNIVQMWTDDSLTLVAQYGLDSAIWDHQNPDYRAVPFYSESTDGGISWFPAQLQFGTQISDYPTAKVIVDGFVRQVPACGGAYWASVSNGFISNGIIYMVTPGSLIDFDSSGFASDIEVAILSMKPVGIGGTWTHKVISGDVVINGTTVAYGYQRYGELSMRNDDPNHMIFVYNDLARPTEQIAFTGTCDGGATWIKDTTNMIFIDQVSDLGFSSAAALYLHTAEKFTSSGVDITLLTGADAAITNETQYHIRVPVPGFIGISENDVTVNEFKMSQNYPNPFNPSTTIRYQIPVNSKVSLKIYNMLGQEVRTLVNAKQNAGSHTIQWDGKDVQGRAVSSGIYIYRLKTGNHVKSQKMMLIR